MKRGIGTNISPALSGFATKALPVRSLKFKLDIDIFFVFWLNQKKNGSENLKKIGEG